MNTKFIYAKVKKMLKKHINNQNKKVVSNTVISHQEEMDENALNEAIEAALSHRIAISPAAAKQQMVRLRLSNYGEVSVYSGCQVAGPQA